MSVALVNRVLRKSFPWLLVFALAAFAVYRTKLAPAPVLMVEVQPGPVVAEVLGTGTLEARISTIISTRIQEHLAEVLVDEGHAVAAGQCLARLDDGELRLQVEVAEAMLAGARATADRVRVDELRAEAVEEQARQNHQRVTELAVQQVSSTAERDKAIELLRVAESDLQRARAATLEARQQVVTAEKTLAYQQERLGFATIVSPYDGLITRRDRDSGGVVVPGASLLQLVSTNELWISAWVDETAADVLALEQPVRVVFRSQPERNYMGEVARLGRETDRETREFLVDVRVQELPVNWTIGQRAEVYIETGRKADTLALPQRFLHWRDGRPSVFVHTDGRATWREVKPGLRGRDMVEIVEGLSIGDQVVAPARPKQTPLKHGQRVAAQ
ncbi:MAG: efflux RND transporter periplasmic adaptor subunit [Verrucomicrobiales bacterium]|nr:efflux RND transporter periplasmic adaptor subunit [Verrucomicrobiales bacterium]